MHFDSQLPWKVIKIESAPESVAPAPRPPNPHVAYSRLPAYSMLRTQLKEAKRNTKNAIQSGF